MPIPMVRALMGVLLLAGIAYSCPFGKRSSRFFCQRETDTFVVGDATPALGPAGIRNLTKVEITYVAGVEPTYNSTNLRWERQGSVTLTSATEIIVECRESRPTGDDIVLMLTEVLTPEVAAKGKKTNHKHVKMIRGVRGATVTYGVYPYTFTITQGILQDGRTYDVWVYCPTDQVGCTHPVTFFTATP